VTSGPSYYSDEEIIKHLQALPRDSATLSASPDEVREARSLAAELAERIYADPATWGIATIPERFRDDAAADAFTALLAEVPNFKGRQSVPEWFSQAVEIRFRRLWIMSEQLVAEQRDGVPKPLPPQKARSRRAADGPTAESVIPGRNALWRQFENDFPRDASTLCLRYVDNRSPEEMAALLDASSVRAVGQRVARARDRFRMFCEQSGLDRHDTADLMLRFGEGPRS
jgi:DNA-directed RNA polymerase specialized sigma24 family protein